MLVPFPPQARTSTGAMPKRLGGTSCPRVRRASAKIMNFSGGIRPLARQLLTAEAPTPASAAASAVPPTASMTASTLSSMLHNSSQNVDQSRGHILAIATDCELWLNSPMITRREFNIGVAHRLKWARAALDKKQGDFAKKMGVGKTAVSNYEKGRRSVDGYGALCLKMHFSIPVEWLFFDDGSNIPPLLAEKLAKTEPAPAKPKRKKA